MVLPQIAMAFFERCIGRMSDQKFMLWLYARSGVKMFALAQSLTNSPQDAEEVVEEAMMALMEKISLLRKLNYKVLESYIFSTVKHCAYSLHRRRRMQNEVYDGEAVLAVIADTAPTPDEAVLQKASIEALMEAIQQLPEEEQVIINMKCLEGCSSREIADVLGIQEGAVRVKLHRARKQLRDMLKEEE